MYVLYTCPACGTTAKTRPDSELWHGCPTDKKRVRLLRTIPQVTRTDRCGHDDNCGQIACMRNKGHAGSHWMTTDPENADTSWFW